MKKKMQYYLPLLAILWAGAFVQSIAQRAENLINKEVIDTLQNGNPVILFEKEYEGKISQAAMEQEASLLLAYYQGEMVKEIIGDNFYSFYGFSDKIKEYVVSDGEKINLNLVITYNEEKDVTCVVWASPFYNGDF